MINLFIERERDIDTLLYIIYTCHVYMLEDSLRVTTHLHEPLIANLTFLIND